MRIVAVADTHLYHDELELPEGDLLIHAGDLCRAGSLDELALALSWLRAQPHSHKLLVAGNHDWPFVRHAKQARELCGNDILYLEDSGVSLCGYSFWGSPWQPRFNDWAFNLDRGAALAEKWALIPDGVDVLVTHGAPHGTGDDSCVGGRFGCEALRDRVRQVRPRVHLFGHIHDDGGAWEREGTLFANVTTWECERAATVITLDDETRAARATVVPPARRR